MKQTIKIISNNPLEAAITPLKQANCKNLKIQLLKSKVNRDAVNYNLNHLFSEKLALLDFYYKAFPKYTLHNSQHQKNILRIIGELLGDQIEKLSSLELAVIILTTVYHDIGMVFTAEELENITNEETFSYFLNENFKAKLLFDESNGSLTKDLAEWYCRWMHAKRVWNFLNDLDTLRWKQISLKIPVGNICESHNEDAKTLIDDEKFKTDFLGEADLRFCAVLLRLADILDFDSTRTPKSVYEYLELDNPKNKNEQISHEEWTKHLCSDGFRIEYQNKELKLTFIAAPEHPQIEKNIQTFLDLIEDEIKKCVGVINKCSIRWREFKLPLLIDRTNIQSINYKKGNYKLSLDETQIIKLLTGENLYDDQFVFVRELLQNAIDTSRMRQYHEISNGNSNFKIKPIDVSTWIDNNGFRWVRVDDYGMGINEYVLKNHLLKKGTSYYNSDYFKIQKLHFQEKTEQEFTPISRFGIGLLSCFILCDSIEINTRSLAIPQTKDAEEKIRLSIQDLQSEYILQTEKDKHQPLEMPGRYGNEKNFRREAGTSIAVRIDVTKDFLQFNDELKNALNSYILCSPIQVIFEGEKVGLDFEKALDTPLAEEKFYPFTLQQKKAIEKLINKTITSDIGIEIIPINLSAASKTPNLKGQLVFIRIKCDDFSSDDFFSDSYLIDFDIVFSINSSNDLKKVTFSRLFKNLSTNKDEEQTVEVLFEEIFQSSFSEFVRENIYSLLKETYQKNKNIHLVHNGITIPNSKDTSFYRDNSKLSFINNLFSYNLYPNFGNDFDYCYFGLIYLQDNLIPDLSIARNVIKGFSFTFYSHLYYACREINKHLIPRFPTFTFLKYTVEKFSLKEILNDDLIKNKTWEEEKLIITKGKHVSVAEIKSALSNGALPIAFHQIDRFNIFLVRALLQLNFNVEYVAVKDRKSYFMIKSKKEESFKTTLLDQLPPLTFVPFDNVSILAEGNYINYNHFFGKWIISNQNTIIKRFYGYFYTLIRFILAANYDGINAVIQHFKRVLPEGQKPELKKITEKDYLNLPDNYYPYLNI